MKRILFPFLLSLLSVLVANAQTEYTIHSHLEMKAYLKKMVEQKWFIDRPLSELYDAFKKVGFPIKHMSTMASGGYVNPDGEDMTTGVVIYNADLHTIDTGARVFSIYIELDIYKKDRELWSKLPDDGWMEILQKRTQEYRITDITYEFGAIVPRKK